MVIRHLAGAVIWKSEHLKALYVKYKKKKKLLQIVERLRNSEDDGHMVVIIGADKDSMFFAEKIKKYGVNLWGICCISENPKIENIEIKDYNDLLYEDIENLQIFEFEKNTVVRTLGILLDMGVQKEQIHVLGGDQSEGCRLFDTYDINLGLCWESEPQGFKVFENPRTDESIYTIVTLGGSTSDPYLYNIKSWSEYLWEILNEMGLNVKVICGGTAAYTVTQEWIKLYRDVIPMNPNLVISYSGVNDFIGTHYSDYSRYATKYMVANLERDIKDNRIINTLQFHNVIKKFTLGGYKENAVEHWIRCERMMHGVCQEFGIAFLGFLQPYNKAEVNNEPNAQYKNGQYILARQEIAKSGNPWLIDFTELFDGREGVYTDNCHVYESGNEIIARTMLEYILKEKNG